ncbi:MAG TPA: hypothetical protein VGC56_17490 [Allosphingosinicella sp.]|jgi:hypothetical protein
MPAMLLLSLAAATAVPAGAHPVSAPAQCRNPGITYAAPSVYKAQPQKLGALPPARHYLAVDRHVGGCPAPAVVRSGIGALRR